MAKEAWPFLFITGSIFFLSWILFYQFEIIILGFVGGIFLVATLFIAFFFRDPERCTPLEAGLVVSSGDGKVVAIQPTEIDSWLGEKGIQVSIFLSIFNVHINRIPISGQVETVEYRAGRFRLAFRPEASDENEQNIIRIKTQTCKVVVKQVAGFIARRIVCQVSENEPVQIGQRFGLIKFGSRIDLIMPSWTRIKVDVGDRVKAGETVIGVISS